MPFRLRRQLSQQSAQVRASSTGFGRQSSKSYRARPTHVPDLPRALLSCLLITSPSYFCTTSEHQDRRPLSIGFASHRAVPRSEPCPRMLDDGRRPDQNHRPPNELGGKRTNLNGRAEQKSVELVSRILISRNDWLLFFPAAVSAHRLNTPLKESLADFQWCTRR